MGATGLSRRGFLGLCGGLFGVSVVSCVTSPHHLPQEEKQPLTLEEFRQSTLCLLYTPDGKTLISGGGEHINPTYGRVILWDVASRRQRRVLDGHRRPVWDLALSPDSKLLATGGGDGDLRLWSMETGTQVAELWGHDFNGTIQALCFSADGRLLASGESGENRCVMLWDVSAHQRISVLKGFNHQVPILGGQGDIRSFVFLDDGRLLAVADGTGKIKLWDVVQGKEVASRMEDDRQGRCASLNLSRDGQWLAAGYFVSERDTPNQEDAGHAAIWDWRKQQRKVVMTGHKHTVKSLTFFYNDHYLATGSIDKTVRIYEVATGREVKQLSQERSAYTIAVAPNGKTLATVEMDRIRLWDLSDVLP